MSAYYFYRMMRNAVRTLTTSLREASLKPEAVVDLALTGGTDFRCDNLVCGEFGKVCVCKAARWFGMNAARMPRLRSLSLAHNGIAVLPPSVCQLTTLRRLDLRGNQLAELPNEVAGLQELRWVDIRDNAFDATPRVLRELPKLERLLE